MPEGLVRGRLVRGRLVPEAVVAERAAGAVLEGLPPAPVPAEVMSELRTQLLRRLDGLAVASGGPDDRPQVRVDRHRVDDLLACPARAGDPPFRWQAALAARRLGLAAVSHMLLGRSAPLVAVTAALDTALADGGSLGEWLFGLGEQERGAVTAAALSWANRAWTTVGWERLARMAACRLEAGAIRAGLNTAWGRVILIGRPDATLWIRAELGLQQVLVLIGRPRAAAGRLDALAAALQRGRAPLRVVSVDPASGSVGAADVDAACLAQAADDAVTAAEAVLAASRGVALGARPHTGCWSCWRQEACLEGAAWRSRQAARRGGLPIAEAAVTPPIPASGRSD